MNPGYPTLFSQIGPSNPPGQADVNAGDSEGDSPLAHARALMHWDEIQQCWVFFKADRAGDMFSF